MPPYDVDRLRARVVELGLDGATVYLSGPMTGYPDYNFPAFREGAQALRAAGLTVVSPAELDEVAGVEPHPEGDGLTPEEYAGFLARDVEVMAREHVRAVVVLPGWERSGGAKTEVAFGRAIGAAILALPSLTEVPEMVPTTGEVRVVNAETGGMKGRKPQRYELIPWNAVGAIAEVYAFGAQKYDDHNWRKGYDWSLSFGALLRHLTAFWEGEDLDPESGLPHLAHAGFHVLSLLTFMRERPELDDRPHALAAREEERRQRERAERRERVVLSLVARDDEGVAA